jgi:hypothetical protein
MLSARPQAGGVVAVAPPRTNPVNNARRAASLIIPDGRWRSLATYFVKFNIGKQQRRLKLGTVVRGNLKEMRRRGARNAEDETSSGRGGLPLRITQDAEPGIDRTFLRPRRGAPCTLLHGECHSSESRRASKGDVLVLLEA